MSNKRVTVLVMLDNREYFEYISDSGVLKSLPVSHLHEHIIRNDIIKVEAIL